MTNGATHASGQMQGYLRQIQQMFCELISLEEITVSVEALDDVAVQGCDGSIIVEQMKSVTSGSNPITDRSPILWKTLYNWLQYVLNGDLLIDKTVFRLIVISEKNIADGSIIANFKAAKTIELAKQALTNVKNELWGENQEHKDGISSSYREYVELVFDEKHSDAVCKIISQMSVVTFESDYDEQLKKKFTSIPGLPPEFSEELYTYMRGWVDEKVVEQCKLGKPAYIHNSEFNSALAAQQRAYNQSSSIPALSPEINEEVAKGVVRKPDRDTYIHQLELIESDFTDKCQAASDYLRTKEETTIRAEKGLFIPESMDDYADRLKRSWKSAHTRAMLSGGTDVEKGALSLSDTSEAVLALRLQGADVPSFFSSGKLHALANAPKEEPEIGWHPQYKTLLKGSTKNE